MTEDTPTRPPEGALLRLVRLAAGMSVQDAATAAGISKARWSQVVGGHESRRGRTQPVVASDGLLARMAAAVGVDADRIEQAGRPDAAEVLREMQRRRPSGEPAPGLTDDERELTGAFLEALRARRADSNAGDSDNDTIS